MKHQKWSKRDPIKNYFPVPNEVFLLGLSPGELAVYSYLLFCEDRSTYQCWPSFKTIGKATGMSTNTVRKYVRMLEDRESLTQAHTAGHAGRSCLTFVPDVFFHCTSEDTFSNCFW